MIINNPNTVNRLYTVMNLVEDRYGIGRDFLHLVLTLIPDDADDTDINQAVVAAINELLDEREQEEIDA